MYEELSLLEHILDQPHIYIGSVDYTTELTWVYNEKKHHMVQREISYVPGLYKIYDEILINAADNKRRDQTMSAIKIDIDAENNSISIWNNGRGIPGIIHEEQNMYVPTMIFGHLCTSSYDDDDYEQRIIEENNATGAKLCNIFSSSFTVETATREYMRTFKQSWNSNMTQASDPVIDDFDGADYTKITFSPDLSRFDMERLDEGIVALMSRRAFDIAATVKGVAVYLNGKRLGITNFKGYVNLHAMQSPEKVRPIKVSYDQHGERRELSCSSYDRQQQQHVRLVGSIAPAKKGGRQMDVYVRNLYAKSEEEQKKPIEVVFEKCGRWEVACCPSDGGFQQISFVNSVATTRGGTHVDHVVDILIKQLLKLVDRPDGTELKPCEVRNRVWVFVNCLMENPTFESQAKDKLTLAVRAFDSKCRLSKKFISRFANAAFMRRETDG